MHASSNNGNTIVIDPVTRIEGHMKVEAVVDGGAVKDARCSGTMFRGFERILIGRHPLDAARLTQRVCGVCPTAHASASAFCLDRALGAADRIPDNGRIVRNLILGANYVQSHVLHFFTLAALDYVDAAAAADYDGDDADLKNLKAFIGRGHLGPFLPRYEGDYRCSREENLVLLRHYLQALRGRRTAHEMLSVFGGKMPHNVGIVPGGVCCEVTADKVASFAGKLAEIRDFIDTAYIPSVLLIAGRYGDCAEIGAGCGRYLSYGAFPAGTESAPAAGQRLFGSGLLGDDGRLQTLDPDKIAEDVANSRYEDACSAAPAEGQTLPDPHKDGAYSWIKAPRYDGKPAEVGPLARAMVGYAAGDPTVKPAVDAALAETGLPAEKLDSILGRHLARALETKWVAEAMAGWLEQLKPGEPAAAEISIPDEAEAAGMTGAPRGALGHWIRIKDKKIDRYQMVVPTTWNAGPRDGEGVAGPMEQALIGAPVKDAANPFEVVRIVRSFDPCLACAVHVIDAHGNTKGQFRAV